MQNLGVVSLKRRPVETPPKPALGNFGYIWKDP